MTPRWRLLGLALLAGMTLAALVAAGGALQPVHPGSIHAWIAWLDDADPVTIAVASLRIAASMASAWVGTTALLHLGAMASPHLAWRGLDRLTPRLVRSAAGASLSLVVLAGPSFAVADGDPAHQATMRPVPTTIAPPTTTTVPSAPRIEPPAPTPAPAARPAPMTRDSYVVERNDSLWSIAVETLTERLGRPPTEPEVRTYWHGLISANARRLVVPGNPDLIYSGQVLVLPA